MYLVVSTECQYNPRHSIVRTTLLLLATTLGSLQAALLGFRVGFTTARVLFVGLVGEWLASRWWGGVTADRGSAWR